jgi:glycosyltransferase involved in cell wall biosynthesis
VRELERILYILPRPVYPPDSGPSHHTYGLLKYISRRYECDIVGFVKNPEDYEHWIALQNVLPNIKVIKTVKCHHGITWTMSRARKFLFGLPVSFAAYEDRELRAWLRDKVDSANYDLVHFDTFNVSMYRSLCAHLPTVLVPYDAFSMGAKRAFDVVKTPSAKLSYLWKWWAYSRYERHAYRHFTKVCPVSDVDTAWLTSLDPAIDAQTVGIPIGEEFLCDIKPHRDNTSPHIVCCGSLNTDAVVEGVIEFLSRVYPSIRDRIPEARVSIWGNNLFRRLRRTLLRFPDVHYVSYVEDYLEFLKSASVYVLPQRSGSGIQTKVQQAMALGVPVVTRPHVLHAIGAEGDAYAFAYDDNAAMAQCVVRLTADAELRTRVGHAGARYIRQTYSLDQIGAKLEKIYLDAIVKHADTVPRQRPYKRPHHGLIE